MCEISSSLHNIVNNGAIIASSSGTSTSKPYITLLTNQFLLSHPNNLTMLSSLFGYLSASDDEASKQILNAGNINNAVKLCKYDVRGEIYLAAVKRAQEGKEVIYTNVGNPHAVGESPISFTRQVLSLVSMNAYSHIYILTQTHSLVSH